MHEAVEAEKRTAAAAHVRAADASADRDAPNVRRELERALEMLPGYGPAAIRLTRFLERSSNFNSIQPR